MKRHLPVIAVLLGLLAAALLAGASAPAPAAAGSAVPLTFYQHAPAGWQAKPVGTLLKWQQENPRGKPLQFRMNQLPVCENEFAR